MSDQKGADLLNAVADLGGLGSASGLQPIPETSARSVGGDTGRPRQHAGVYRDLSGGRYQREAVCRPLHLAVRLRRHVTIEELPTTCGHR